MKSGWWVTVVWIAMLAVAMPIGWFYSSDAIEGSAHLTVPEGASTFASYRVDDVEGFSLSGEFSSSTDSPVELMILDEGEYLKFLANSSYVAEFRAVAISGEFSVDKPSMETCHIVVRHGAGLIVPQEVEVSYTISAVNPVGMLSAYGFAFGGGLLIVYDGWKRHKKHEEIVRESKPLDVIFFDSESR